MGQQAAKGAKQAASAATRQMQRAGGEKLKFSPKSSSSPGSISPESRIDNGEGDGGNITFFSSKYDRQGGGATKTHGDIADLAADSAEQGLLGDASRATVLASRMSDAHAMARRNEFSDALAKGDAMAKQLVEKDSQLSSYLSELDGSISRKEQALAPSGKTVNTIAAPVDKPVIKAENLVAFFEFLKVQHHETGELPEPAAMAKKFGLGSVEEAEHLIQSAALPIEVELSIQDSGNATIAYGMLPYTIPRE
eukprot:g1608.t1